MDKKRDLIVVCNMCGRFSNSHKINVYIINFKNYGKMVNIYVLWNEYDQVFFDFCMLFLEIELNSFLII